MPDQQDDHQLLATYARDNSEAAFTTLVTRHLGLVYSAALRHSGDAHGAEEIAQAVFIILARKAGGLSAKTILSGWLYQTTRLTAANYLRTERRRQQREQEAYMQSLNPQPEVDHAWAQIAPLLDDALAKLGTRDRDAIVLRFFENKSAREIAAALRLEEAAAHKRVQRAVAKLRKFFLQRGVTLSAAAITGAVSVNSVQAAPMGLAKTISAGASLKGATATLATATLAKGALKMLAWSKMKMAIITGIIVLTATGTTIMVAENIIVKMNSVLKQSLPDGSILSIEMVSFGDKHEFFQGNKKVNWNWPGHDELVLSLKLAGKNAANNQLVKPDFFRQFRCRLHGEQGIEYVEELLPTAFEKNGDAYYGYVETSMFPRDARWLSLDLEKRDENARYDSWQRVAEFKFKNLAAPQNFKWTASPTPVTNTVAGMDLVMDEISVKTIPNYTNDIWNHVVNVPTQVFESGILQTNWTAAYTYVTDASGNWNANLQRHRSLDPRYVWKLDMDFEPKSNFPEGCSVSVAFPRPAMMITNILDIPVTVSWDGKLLTAFIPQNRTDVALKFIGALDSHNRQLKAGGASWSKYSFREGDFSAWIGKNSMTSIDVKPVQFTFAIIPNVHTTFYAQPKLETP
ncbi:MAG TPA: sigma-70 family RNA polymerase sigma factor [Verrucomicrobiae bacterium]|jgi:RNA polymerase sigma factor (sigma-70 family)